MRRWSGTDPRRGPGGVPRAPVISPTPIRPQRFNTGRRATSSRLGGAGVTIGSHRRGARLRLPRAGGSPLATAARCTSCSWSTTRTRGMFVWLRRRGEVGRADRPGGGDRVGGDRGGDDGSTAIAGSNSPAFVLVAGAARAAVQADHAPPRTLTSSRSSSRERARRLYGLRRCSPGRSSCCIAGCGAGLRRSAPTSRSRSPPCSRSPPRWPAAPWVVALRQPRCWRPVQRRDQRPLRGCRAHPAGPRWRPRSSRSPAATARRRPRSASAGVLDGARCRR